MDVRSAFIASVGLMSGPSAFPFQRLKSLPDLISAGLSMMIGGRISAGGIFGGVSRYWSDYQYREVLYKS